jgi:alpha-ribazole phosphatase
MDGGAAVSHLETGTGAHTVYLMRHGDSRPDAVRRFVGRTDYSLNDAGRAQAEWWRGELSQVPISRVCCSDLKRSVETAKIIGEGRSAPLTRVPEFREIDLGAWDGLAMQDVRRQFPAEYERRGADLAGYRPPQGESFADLSDRVLPAFEEVIRESSGSLLIIGHAGVNRVILCHLLGMPLANLFRLGQEYGCLNVVEFAGDAVVRSVNRPVGIRSGR